MGRARPNLKGSRRASIRSALNKAEREGITFHVVPVEEVAALMPEIERVSDEWLAEHKVREKAFSLGAFDRDYVATQPQSQQTTPVQGPPTPEQIAAVESAGLDPRVVFAGRI